MTVATFPLDERGSLVWMPHPGEHLERAATALVLDAGVLLVDPLDAPGLDEVIAPLGPLLGTCTLLDRHDRDADRIAARHGVPRLAPAVLAGSGAPLALPGVFERVILAAPLWNESCLWLPERRLLIAADAVGTASYYLSSPDERLAVNPILRLRPPRGALSGLAPEAIAVGHGRPLTDGAVEALERALATARRRLPASWARAARGWLPSRR